MKLASFEALATALEMAGVRYLVAGGLAVGAHGYLRFTKDVDIVVQLVPDNIERTFNALASLGYRPIVPITMKQFSNNELRTAARKVAHPFCLAAHVDSHETGS
ncbi:MAG TPA: hypothetical protein VHB68_13890 [Steroidobacteraceae bacterium]|nr:hypothetical protein [Steroidobacteraceae bacterium]